MELFTLVFFWDFYIAHHTESFLKFLFGHLSICLYPVYLPHPDISVLSVDMEHSKWPKSCTASVC